MPPANINTRFIAILSVWTFINIIFFYSTIWYKNGCSVSVVVAGISHFIRHGGKYELGHGMPEECLKPELKVETQRSLSQAQRSLSDAVQKVMSDCNRKKMYLEKYSPKKLIHPFLTLFTTWTSSQDEQKILLHNITLRNWSSFKPAIHPIVFTNDSSVKAIAKESGWTVLPIRHHDCGGIPVLKTMYSDAMLASRNSALYGYANADILFTKDLILTLEFLLQKVDLSSPFLIVGRRTNVNGVTLEEASEEALLEAATSRGVLFKPHAADYFITNNAYPWHRHLDFVIGRIGYDNWLVGYTRCSLNISVIDVTDTALAAHQTTLSGGNFESRTYQNIYCNFWLLKRAGVSPVFPRGYISCANYRTYNSFCGLELTRKGDEEIHSDCSCTSRPENYISEMDTLD